MARRAARTGAVLGGNDAELNDLVAALESEVEERAAATERHDKKPAAKQFAHCSRVNSGHVTALVRADRRSFRHYDNDSDARQRGTFVSVSLRAVWGPFILYAVVQKGSPLLRALLMSCSRYAWVMLTLRENGVSAFILLYYVVRSVLNYVLISDVMYTHLEKVS